LLPLQEKWADEAWGHVPGYATASRRLRSGKEKKKNSIIGAKIARILASALSTWTGKEKDMSIFDAVKQMAGQATGAQDHAAVAGGLLQELGGSGGVGGLIQTLQQNGAGNMIQQWASGNTQAIDPNSIEQMLGNTGMVDSIAQRTGVSADTVRSSLATIVPVLVHHVTSNGHVTTDGQPTGNPAPEAGSLVQSLLGKIF
jgi:uncharacterized protein YidB (DUF937 family)